MKTDVVIVGGGPAGISAAISLSQKGIASVIVEREQFPRFHIGESMTGECGATIRSLGIEQRMIECEHPVKYGTRVFGGDGKNEFYIPVMARDADGNLRDQTTWQVRRSDFDKMLQDEALKLGISQIDGRASEVLRDSGGTPCGVGVKLQDGTETRIHAKVIVDASGQKTFLSNAGITGKKERGNYSKQVAIYTHVKGAIREEGEKKDDTLIFYQKKNHWAWFIPLDPEIVSVGVVTPSDYFKSGKESMRDFFLREIRELNPRLHERTQDIEIAEEMRATSNYSYHIKEFTGKGYLCVGDSHRFIDPIFSLGMHFATVESRFAADAIADYLQGKTADQANPFQAYQELAERGQDVIQDMLDAFWDYPLAFYLFIKDKRYRDSFIDMFAGRVYDSEPSDGLKALRTLLANGRMKTMEAAT